MSFHNPSILIHLLWLLPLFAGLVYLGIRRRQQRLLNSFRDDNERNGATMEVSTLKRRIRRVLMGLVLVFCGIAVARPQWGQDELGISSSGGDVTIALDVSRSMYARDIKPDRLTVAKNLIRDLMSALPSHRFSLVVFAGKAYTACPMTNSRSSLQMILDDVSPITMPYGGTNLEEALKEALSSEEGAETSNRTLIIFSDGDLQQGEADTLISRYQESGVPVMSVGVGVAGSNALIQLPDNNFVRFNGKPVRSSLDSASLMEISRQTGGSYWQADNEPILPERLAATISQLQSSTSGESRISRPTERHQWPVACALICIVAAVVISDRRKVALALLVMAAAMAKTPAMAEEIPEAVIQAELAYDAETDPTRKVALQYNLATAIQIESDRERAVENYKGVILSNYASEGLRAAAMQNLAGIYFSSGEELLAETPEEAMSDFNKVIVLCKAILDIQSDDSVVKTLETARNKLATAEENYRKQEELKKLKSDAVQSLKTAANAQGKTNQRPNQESQTEARNLTQDAQKKTSKLKDGTLDSLVDQALKHQNRVLGSTETRIKEAVREEAMETLVKALEHLGVKYQKPNDSGQSGKPPKDLPKDQKFEDVKDKKKRAVLILRAMRKEEENQRKEIRDAREKAFRARLGEERDW